MRLPFFFSTRPAPEGPEPASPATRWRLPYRWLALVLAVGVLVGAWLGLLLPGYAATAGRQYPLGLHPINGLTNLGAGNGTASAGASPTSNPTATKPGKTPTPGPTYPPVPPGAHHFAFGVDNQPGSVQYLNTMRSQNGAAFDYRYQYLAGGVNTGHGWETWNSPAGAFASYYIQESVSNQYIPTLVYYEMLQSNGTCTSCGEQQKDLSNLANPAIMNAYYANWALLMQKLGASNQRTLVIVEPDLWGFMQQSVVGGSNSATSVPASVASSGYAAAANLPNTAQGFALALLHIRDLNAPKAVLALHASNWATNIDISSDKNSGLNVGAVAQKEANFLLSAGIKNNPNGISHWDLLSNDIADHDSGQSGIWWDRTNATLPNFSRYLQFITALTADSGLHVMMWQVPVGNQYFDTENNSAGHTQDNRAEYILGHVADFVHAGIIGVLFGAGNSGTEYNDVRKDGTTNPAPISTYQCNQCNNHQSQYADDDGGYLRIFVGQYYKNGTYPLPAGW
ncbi:MAG TPA: hypothetical protein VH540_11320 [Ktedonobacterales bacterium]